MTIAELQRSAYYAGDGTLRVPCPHCYALTHAFVGYSIREAARKVQRGEACYR